MHGSWCLLIATIFILLTLFFSVSHLALRHVSWVKLEEAFLAQGCPQRVQTLRDRQSKLVSSTATLRLLSSLVLPLCVVYYLALDDGGAGVLLLVEAFIISALMLSVFSVAIPYTWAKYAGTSLLVRCYPVLRLLEWIVWPLTAALDFIDPVIRRLAGVSVDQSNDRLDEKQEELLNVVEEGEKEGVVDEEEREMITSVLEFRDTTTGEIMTPRTEVVGIDTRSSLSEAVEIVMNKGHSRYPVYEGTIDKVVGLLYAKDLLSEVNHPDGISDIRHRLREPFFVPESKTVRDLLHDFQNQKIHVAVVLDEYGGTAGLVTIEDVLEELVGEIVDEYEPPQSQPIKKINENTIEVDARFEVDQLNDEFDLKIPDSADYETLGGFAFSKLGYIPKAGETFEHENLHFTIIDAGDRKINRLQVVITPHQEEPQD